MRYVYQTCPCGNIRGIGTDHYLLFKGIPYAHAARWNAPQEITKWTGIHDGTIQGTWCCQYDAFLSEKTASGRIYADETVEKQVVIYSEDCLNLNIWTPVHSENAPVLVFIHGGSYETGGGSAYTYDGKNYCQQGVILVTINYRLNAFASAVGEGCCGNYGLQDQICALQWIKHNISAFGGDPDRVTIMGESAGAMGVQNLIFSPAAKGLFCGAIMMSGGGILPNAFKIKEPATAKKLWECVQKKLGVSSLEQLRTVPAKDLFLVWKNTCMSNPDFSFAATPVIDGELIPEDPRILAETGQINGVPTIIGLLSEDMWPLDLYRAAMEWATLMNSSDMPPVYGFYFNRSAPGSDFGAFHGIDLRYAFRTFDISWRPFNEIDERISASMIDYFSNFAKTGSPNSENLPSWSSITQENREFMNFGDMPCEMRLVPEDHLMHVQMRGKPFPGM